MKRRSVEVHDEPRLRALLYELLRQRQMHSVGGGGLLDSFCKCFGRWWMVLGQVSHVRLSVFAECNKLHCDTSRLAPLCAADMIRTG